MEHVRVDEMPAAPRGARGLYDVVAERTPYSKARKDKAARVALFSSHGYVVTLQDRCGCFASEGELDFLRREPQDGYETVEFLAAQPHCNGRAGTYGISYSGWTQSQAATQAPPYPPPRHCGRAQHRLPRPPAPVAYRPARHGAVSA